MCADMWTCRDSTKYYRTMIDGHGDDLYRYNGIRMNFSTNIFADTTETTDRLEEFLRTRLSVVRSYPEPTAHSLEQMIAQEYGIADDEVMVTSGATDAIYLIAQTFRHYGSCHILQPTFNEYADACRTFGLQEQPNGALAWVCNPNNPTGEVRSPEEMRRLAAKHRMLIVDQSYEDYTLETLWQPNETVRTDNIILLHSMTKRYGVPGLRLGFITAKADIIALLRAQYRPWAVNALALEAGKWLVRNGKPGIANLPEYLHETERLRQGLSAIRGIEAYPTQTNFFLCRIELATAHELKEYLAFHHGMLIRDASNFVGLTPHHFRLAAQTPEKNDALLNAIHHFLCSISGGSAVAPPIQKTMP